MSSLSRIMPHPLLRESDEMDATFFGIRVPNGFRLILPVVLVSEDEVEIGVLKQIISELLDTYPWCFSLKVDLVVTWVVCINFLHSEVVAAADSDGVSQIGKWVDNLVWLLDLLIHRRVAEKLLVDWAEQRELSKMHSRVPAKERFNVSRLTGRLFMAIGEGELSPSPETTQLLLKNWLMPFYDDFSLIKASGTEECNLMENGLTKIMLTLPAPQQQMFLLVWADRVATSGKHSCPNLKVVLETWWRKDSPNYSIKDYDSCS